MEANATEREMIKPEHFEEYRSVRNRTIRMVNDNKAKNFSSENFSVEVQSNGEVYIIYKSQSKECNV